MLTVCRQKFGGIWDSMNISYNHFIRTTDETHENAVKHIFKKLYDQGDIYKEAMKDCTVFRVSPFLPKLRCQTENALTAARLSARRRKKRISFV